jgi:hypothetical protein
MEVVLCQGESITLDFQLWHELPLVTRGETTNNYRFNYRCVQCEYYLSFHATRKVISVTERPEIISSVVVNDSIMNVAETEYWINGFDFQVSNQFSYISSGQYTALLETITELSSARFHVFTCKNISRKQRWVQ